MYYYVKIVENRQIMGQIQAKSAAEAMRKLGNCLNLLFSFSQKEEWAEIHVKNGVKIG